MLRMLRLTRAVLSFCVIILTPGCVRAAPKPPPLKEVELAGSRGAFRAYGAGTVDICDAEPQWLAEELASVNALIRRFLAATDRPSEAEWSREEISVLEQGLAVLPEVLNAHRKNLSAVKRCSFARQAAFVDVLKTGTRQNSDAARRLAAGQELLTDLKAARELEQWRRRIREERAELASFCDGATATIYFAYENEQGDVRYFFCDDAQVTFPNGKQTPEVSRPAGLSGRRLRAWKEGPYVKRAKAFPRSEVRVPPTLPDEPSVSTAKR